MAKAKGKISKMSLKKAAIAISRVEFDYFMKDGYHDQEKSYFDNKTGGYVVVKMSRKEISEKKKVENLEDVAALILAKKGYKVYLGDDYSKKFREKISDGLINHVKMDIKTVNTAGKSTIKSKLEDGAAQEAKIVILMQNTQDMTPGYVESQLKLFSEKSPYNCRKQIKKVIVIYDTGKIRHYSMKRL